MFTLFYVTIALSVFVIITAADQGGIYVIKSLLYPVFTFQVVFMWCLAGQLLMDEVLFQCHFLAACRRGERFFLNISPFQSINFQTSLMASNWTDAPLKYRKLMLMFMIRCSHPMTVHGKPFYSINREACSDVSARSGKRRRRRSYLWDSN